MPNLSSILSTTKPIGKPITILGGVDAVINNTQSSLNDINTGTQLLTGAASLSASERCVNQSR
jgi:hypothetical protein